MNEEMTVQTEEIVVLLKEYLENNGEAIQLLGDEFYKDMIEEKTWNNVIAIVEFFHWLYEVQPVLLADSRYKEIADIIYQMLSDTEIVEDFIDAIETKDQSLVGDMLNDEWGPSLQSLSAVVEKC